MVEMEEMSAECAAEMAELSPKIADEMAVVMTDTWGFEAGLTPVMEEALVEIASMRESVELVKEMGDARTAF
jgi:hypothetical protein